MSLIKLIDVTKVYKTPGDDVLALNNVNLSIGQGELVGLMGVSGSGKTTLMNIIGLLDNPTSGAYLLDGKDVSNLTDDEQARTRNKKIGFVFQSFFLLPRLTALHNVALPLLYRGLSFDEAKEIAHATMENVKIANFYNRKPNELSGGQQQRVAIARALVGKPSLLLADEPTGALDSHTTTEIMDLFIELQQEKNCTVVIVTHDVHVGNYCNPLFNVIDGKIASENSDAYI